MRPTARTSRLITSPLATLGGFAMLGALVLDGGAQSDDEPRERPRVSLGALALEAVPSIASGATKVSATRASDQP